MRILISLIIIMFLSGCYSTKIENKEESIFLFIDKYIPKLEKYIQEDPKLSIRDKNTFKIQIEHYKQSRKDFKNK